MAGRKFLVTMVILAMLVVFVTSSLASSERSDDQNDLEHDDDDDSLPVAEDHDPNQDEGEDEPESNSIGLRRFLASKRTCNKYPRVCRATGSAGPDCCKKKCVDTLTDRSNCGSCGRKCRFNQSCCSGKCVNLSTNRNNCGSCGKKCSSAQRCISGLCNYA